MFRFGTLWLNKVNVLLIAIAFAVLAMNPYVSRFAAQFEHLDVFSAFANFLFF